MAFELPSLPYADDALAASGLSAQTISFHHGKHHKAYVDNLNNLVKDTDLADKTLEEVIKISYKEGKAGIFNNGKAPSRRNLKARLGFFFFFCWRILTNT